MYTLHGNFSVSASLPLVSRSDWSARPPVKPPAPLDVLPASYVIIDHTSTSACYTKADCTKTVQNVQTDHINSKGWDDISYNFLIGDDGYLYEGRGWDVQSLQGPYTKNYSNKSIGIGLIGYKTDEPTYEQLETAINFLEYALINGKLSSGFQLVIF